MKNERPLITDLTEMQHDHSSAAMGGRVPRTVAFGNYIGTFEDGATFLQINIPIACRLSAGLTESGGTIANLFASDVVLPMYYDGSLIGQVNIAAGAASPTFTFVADVDLAALHTVLVVQPTPLVSGGGVSLTFVAHEVV